MVLQYHVSYILFYVSLQPIQSRVRVGMFCVAPFADDSGTEYYRGRVQAVENKFDDQLRAYRETVEVNGASD